MRLSITAIKTFKACRREYFLKYIEGLEPVKKPEALEIGSNYHQKIEQLYATGDVDISDFSKESAMAVAYKKYIYPHFKMKAAEEWVEKDIGKHTLFGRVDGLSEDGFLVEHKSVGYEINPDYEYKLMWDEQILAYMLMSNTNKVYYTVCRKPILRQKNGESDWEFFLRMVAWYDDYTDAKIRLMVIERTDEEIQAFAKQAEEIADEIENAHNYYLNTCHCFRWGRQCEYASVCLHYDPNQQYLQFTRREEQ